MKRPNFKLYLFLHKLEKTIFVLFCTGIFILLLFVFDSALPFFKFSLLFSKITAWTFLALSLFAMCMLYKHIKLKAFQSFSNKKRILYSIVWLFLLLFFLLTIEFISYLSNKEYFNIENEYSQTSIDSKINRINEDINYSKRYMNKYQNLYNSLNPNQYLGYQENNDIFFTTIDKDTVILHLNRRPNVGITVNRFNKDKMSFEGVKEVGISLKNESYNLSHPSNPHILKSMKHCDSIKGLDFSVLVKDKIKFYKHRYDKYSRILEKELTISLFDFIEYNIFNPSITGNKTHILIRFIVLLQAIIITFISGYIYQTLYKILDGDNKPEQ